MYVQSRALVGGGAVSNLSYSTIVFGVLVLEPGNTLFFLPLHSQSFFLFQLVFLLWFSLGLFAESLQLVADCVQL